MARKNITTPISTNAAHITVGLDIGYGWVKAVTSSATITFPSVAGHAREIKFRAQDLATKYPGQQLFDDDGRWFIGELALTQIPAGELLRLRGRTANESTMGNAFRLRLAKVAVGKLLTGCFTKDREIIHVKVATGLPVDHMPDAAALKETLLGQHRIQTDSCDVLINITDVAVMPQPYGTIYSKMLTASGGLNPHHTAMRTGVCDVGTYTVDVTLDDDGEYIDAESGSVEAGVHTAQDRIGAALEREFRQKMPFKVIEEVLRTGRVRAAGEVIDFSHHVTEALQPIRSATINLLSEKFKAGAGVDVIYLSGGGADLVFRDVVAAFPQTERLQDAQLANARGYLNYARYKEAQGE